jgi:hypothetical protein
VLAEEVMPGPEPDKEKLEKLWAECVGEEGYFAKHGVQAPKFNISMNSLGRYSKQKYPELPSFLKAATMTPIAKFLADRTYVLDDGSDYAKLRRINAWGLAEYCHLVDTLEPWLTQDHGDLIKPRSSRRGTTCPLTYRSVHQLGEL